MKPLLTISRLLVGILFIFSGLIKANDPLGLSYKMQEFFHVWGLKGLDDYTLMFSVVMIGFEIIAGVAVILGWQFRLFSWLLLLLILFFTFLTGYAVLTDKIKECGCFGDCIKLTAMDSFIKDLVLLGLILLLFVYRKRVQPVAKPVTNIIILSATTILAFTIQWYVLQHLPIVDCLPFKVGNNIPEKMKPPVGSIPDSTVITFVYKKDGKDVEFTADKFPADFDDSYQFVKRYDKVVRKGNAEIPIKDFTIQTFDGAEITTDFLNEPGTRLILFLKDGYSTRQWPAYIQAISKIADSKNIPGFLITNVPKEQLENDSALSFPLFQLRSDVTAIKTAARTNPTLYLIKQGTILRKWGYADFNLALREITAMQNESPPLAPKVDSTSNGPDSTGQPKPVPDSANDKQ